MSVVLYFKKEPLVNQIYKIKQNVFIDSLFPWTSVLRCNNLNIWKLFWCFQGLFYYFWITCYEKNLLLLFSAVAFNSQHQFFFSHIGNALLKWRLISITQFLYDPWISGLIKQRQSCLVTHEFKEDNCKSIIFTRLLSVSYSCSFVPMGDWLQNPTHYRDTKICGQWSHLSKILQYLYTAC